MYRKYGKRVLDIVGATVLLTLSSPVFFGVSIMLWVQNNGRVFFYQERPGKNESPFCIIKFKTMTDERDSEGRLLPDVERITAVGNWVRRLSLDELPQLINVLRGEMSLIGPRPLLFDYLPLYSDRQRKRHEVKPGITGWAQVNGRNSISWTKKFELDLHYVENVSFSLDMKIMMLTLYKIVRREGINQSEARPMKPFNGSN